MSLLARGLYPTDAAMTEWTTTASFTTWSNVDADAWTAVLTILGAAGVNAPVLIAAIPPHLLIEAIATWRTDVVPTTMEAVRVSLTFNAIRLRYDMAPVDLLPPPVAAAPPPATIAAGSVPAGPPSATLVTIKVKICQVIDQGSDQEVLLLPAADINEMRRRYIDIHGNPPLQRREVSDSLLTARAFQVN
jgi:hypothetical protein